MTHQPDSRDAVKLEYDQEHLGLPEWGIRHWTHPVKDNRWWYTIYRQCCTATSWGGFVLAAHITDAKSEWNHDALFDYMDRYMAIEQSQSSTFVKDMWNTYRESYGGVYSGPLYGP